MDKIWDRNPSKSEVSGRCGRDEKTNAHADKKSNAKKTPPKNRKRNWFSHFQYNSFYSTVSECVKSSLNVHLYIFFEWYNTGRSKCLENDIPSC